MDRLLNTCRQQGSRARLCSYTNTIYNLMKAFGVFLKTLHENFLSIDLAVTDEGTLYLFLNHKHMWTSDWWNPVSDSSKYNIKVQ